MSLDYQLIADSLPKILQGMGVTLQLLGLSVFLGLILAIILLLMRISNQWFCVGVVKGYIYLFRGTPMLVQLFLIYNGLPQFDWIKDSVLWPFLREPFWCAVLALTLNTAAYVSEILRGGILGVDNGLIEAGKSLGLSRSQRFIHITAPIAIRLSLPAYSNEIVSMLKATSLASMVTLMDITYVARTISSQTFATYEIFIAIAGIYLVMTWVIQQCFKLIEQRISLYVRN